MQEPADETAAQGCRGQVCSLCPQPLTRSLWQQRTSTAATRPLPTSLPPLPALLQLRSDPAGTALVQTPPRQLGCAR